MPQLQLKFSNTSWFVTQSIERDLTSETGVTSAVLEFATEISGILTISAETESDLEAAVEYLDQHRLYKHHFKRP
jgi:hypothetical protein